METKYFMNLALENAKMAAQENEVPVGAVIVRGENIIGVGRNRREKSNNALAHAEIEAIDMACKKLGSWRLDGCEMYVTLEPCAMCTGAIINSRLSRVVFGAYDKAAGACCSAANLPEAIAQGQTQIIGGYMEQQCREILQAFFADIRKNNAKEALI